MKAFTLAAVTLIALTPVLAHAQTSTTTTITTPTTATVTTPVTSSSTTATTHHTTTVKDLKTEKDMTPDGKDSFNAERNAATDTAPKPEKVTGSVETQTDSTTTTHTDSTAE